MPSTLPHARAKCSSCGQIEGTNPDCYDCQDVATADANRSTAKAGAVADRQMGAPRAFSSSGRVD